MNLYTHIPLQVSSIIEGFYNEPIKMQSNGEKKDIRLGSGCPRKEECYILADFFLNRKPARSLDFGLGNGTICLTLASCRKFLDLPGKHITLDPLQFSLANGVGLNEIKKYSLDEYVDFIDDCSENYLKEEIDTGNKFDFIFVDGAHDMGHKLVDAFFGDLVLNSSGIIAFHDGLFLSTSTAVTYLIEEKGYQLLHLESNEPQWKKYARMIKHVSRLGRNYCTRAVPHMGYSIVALEKPS